MIVVGQGVVDWVARRTNEFGNFGAGVGIGWQTDGRLRAGVVYGNYNGVNIEMHVASDESGHWLTREFLRVAFDYPFNQAKVNRITALMGSGNEKALRFNQHLGFRHEATLKGAHPTGDLIVRVMWRADCRYLREPYAKPERTVLFRAAA
jgi:RimJ/RimL family protein N-acetyltransferase